MTFCHKNEKPQFLSRKHAVTAFLSRKFMITRSLIAFEDLLASSIAPQVAPPWPLKRVTLILKQMYSQIARTRLLNANPPPQANFFHRSHICIWHGTTCKLEQWSNFDGSQSPAK